MNELTNINSITVSGLKRIYISRRNADHMIFLKHRAGDVCRGDVSPVYIKKALKVFDNGILYMKGNMIAGLCIWKVVDESISIEGFPVSKFMYIYLYCTMENNEKLGSKIMNDVENYCIRQGIQRIELEPTELSAGFYTKMGFVHVIGSLRPSMYKNMRFITVGRRNVTRRIRKYATSGTDRVTLHVGDVLDEDFANN